MTIPQHSQTTRSVIRFRNNIAETVNDTLAVEEPLEIRIATGPAEKRRSRSLSVTMRTPGHDLELAAGFLWTEGIIEDANDIASHEFCGPAAGNDERGNTLLIDLSPNVELDTAALQRHFYTTSSCGVCGKASLDAVRSRGISCLDFSTGPRIPPDLIAALPNRLREHQKLFDTTGGLHAAGLFDVESRLIACREDVGRHNAVDKLLGHRLLDDCESLSEGIMVVSGRASFELVQKALVARIPVMVAVGAPSSLAVEMAVEFGMTLVGFNSGLRFNVYNGVERLDV